MAAVTTDATVALICDMVDEAYVPSRMNPEQAREFLVLLRDEILNRLARLDSAGPAMTIDKYILDEHGNPIVCDDLMKWAEWFENGTFRRLARDTVGTVKVSTVFLGLDHNFDMTGPPILWETVIFGGQFDGQQWRYATRAQALEGHAKALLMVKTAAGRGKGQ